jgi:hypothetical protein
LFNLPTRPESALNQFGSTISSIPMNIGSKYYKKNIEINNKKSDSFTNNPSIELLQISKNSMDINESIID